MARKINWNKNKAKSEIKKNVEIVSEKKTIKFAYKIGLIKRKGGITSYNAIDKDAMETKVLEIMEKDNYKKILVLNNKTRERKVYLSEL